MWWNLLNSSKAQASQGLDNCVSFPPLHFYFSYPCLTYPDYPCSKSSPFCDKYIVILLYIFLVWFFYLIFIIFILILSPFCDSTSPSQYLPFHPAHPTSTPLLLLLSVPSYFFLISFRLMKAVKSSGRTRQCCMSGLFSPFSWLIYLLDFYIIL